MAMDPARNSRVGRGRVANPAVASYGEPATRLQSRPTGA